MSRIINISNFECPLSVLCGSIVKRWVSQGSTHPTKYLMSAEWTYQSSAFYSVLITRYSSLFFILRLYILGGAAAFLRMEIAFHITERVCIESHAMRD